MGPAIGKNHFRTITSLGLDGKLKFAPESYSFAKSRRGVTPQPERFASMYQCSSNLP
jgi:hypothetical protein